MITFEQACEMLGVHKKTLQLWIRKGIVRSQLGRKPGSNRRVRLFRRSHLHEIMNSDHPIIYSPKSEKWINIADASRIYDIPKTTIRWRRNKGDYPSAYANQTDCWLLRREDFEKYKNKKKM